MEIPAARDPGFLKIIDLTIANDTVQHQAAAVEFERLYNSVRRSENRTYTNDEVKMLPFTASSNIHHAEWEQRKRSAEKLIQYLQKKNKPIDILEVGTGNGWLTAMLGKIKNATVTGTDINATELAQARTVFADKTNIAFVRADLRDEYFDDQKFDCIVFAASVQYFQSFTEIMNRAIALLSPEGEVHIIDSFFHRPENIEQAIWRSKAYYEKMGFAAMSGFYFFHSIQELNAFDHTFLFDPESLTAKLFNRNNIFPWIRITA